MNSCNSCLRPRKFRTSLTATCKQEVGLVRRRIEDKVVRVGGEGLGLEPAGPAEGALAAKADLWDFVGAEDELEIPKEMMAAIVEDPAFDTFEGFAVGQQALVIGEAHRAEAHAEA